MLKVYPVPAKRRDEMSRIQYSDREYKVECGDKAGLLRGEFFLRIERDGEVLFDSFHDEIGEYEKTDVEWVLYQILKAGVRVAKYLPYILLDEESLFGTSLWYLPSFEEGKWELTVGALKTPPLDDSDWKEVWPETLDMIEALAAAKMRRLQRELALRGVVYRRPAQDQIQMPHDLDGKWDF
jgi:hypothetical protein